MERNSCNFPLRYLFSYIQIIVMKLGNKFQTPNSSLTFTKDQISTVNKSLGILEPYVTAELSASQVKEYQDFTIGDGRNYKRVSTTSRLRREANNFGLLSFYNRPLEARSFYSAFQRTFKDEVGSKEIFSVLQFFE